MPPGREAVCLWEEGRIHGSQKPLDFSRTLTVFGQRTVNAKQLMYKHLRWRGMRYFQYLFSTG